MGHAKEKPHPGYPGNKDTGSQDNHQQTQNERILSKDWVEKIASRPRELLSCGNRVFYLDPQAKGYDRWRTGIILQRKTDYDYTDGFRRAHGYDIYDIENCTTVSRTRSDIRKYKHTKAERKILEITHSEVLHSKERIDQPTNRRIQEYFL